MKRKLLALLTTLCLLVGLFPALDLSAGAAGSDRPTIELDGVIYEGWGYTTEKGGKIVWFDSVAVIGVADGAPI